MYHRALVGGQGAGLFKAIYAAKPKQQRALLKIFYPRGRQGVAFAARRAGAQAGLGA
ncbi:hypothetical protein HMPREF1978_00813 [Actinomyces graevenitzii F0530]|uniref:Uncharacterized protein n=1 Tax=Actinomyces graevenitzii F0530 TaxID=1321817 RepID=U1Q3A6_9ACTO|nr:hypothetical protein HMPREF1978_00813 [Actinomyces graevenitzii F0530]